MKTIVVMTLVQVLESMDGKNLQPTHKFIEPGTVIKVADPETCTFEGQDCIALHLEGHSGNFYIIEKDLDVAQGDAPKRRKKDKIN
ncbi:hypothetical protein H0W91_00285 [Patescibacteria group bacterium]|nr:hypothetical protein [Patescibacteria group bacterium]